MRRILSCVCFFILFQTGLKAQDEDALVVQRVIEYLIENAEDDIDFTDLQIRLLEQIGNPINLNTASFDDFRELEILNETQILAIIQHRKSTGPFLSFYELQAVEGFDNEFISLLKSFVTVEENLDSERITAGKLAQGIRGEWFTRYRTIVEDQKGYLINDTSASEGYLGDPYQLYSRLNFRYKKNLSFGITADKDMGEQFFAGNQKNGFDYYSAHFYLGNVGKLKSLAIGDYQMQAGQGLTMWSGLGFGKSADVMNVSKRGRNVTPYRGANENQFLRGAAATYQFGNYTLTGFYSRKKIDGNALTDTLNDDYSAFTSFQTSGFHRTINEIEDKNTIGETIYGGRLAAKFNNSNIGFTGVKTEFDQALSRNIQPYQVLDFAGNSISNLGLDYNSVIGSVYLFGETSFSSVNNSLATVNGALVSFTHQLDGAIVYRNYSPGYMSLYGNSFRESSRSQNERGVYMALKYKPNQYWTLGGYFDQFIFPWLRFGVDLPSAGHEFFADINYHPSRSIEFYGRIKQQIRQRNSSDFEHLRSLSNEMTRSLRFQFRYKVQPFQFTTRVQFATYEIADTNAGHGVLLFQDIAFKPLEKPYSLILRYAMFNVDDFNARIYAYENDVLYSFSVPFYQDKGHRFYALARLKVGRRVDIWLRYARTLVINEETIGSALEEIQGNSKSELKAQLRIKF